MPFAGDGSERKLDGNVEDGAFAQPSGLAVDERMLYVADSESSSLRAVDLESGALMTLAGGNDNPMDLFHFGDEDGAGPGRRFQHPIGVCFHAGQLYVADTYNHKIKLVDPTSGEVQTLAGTARPGAIDGPASEASFHEPSGLAARDEQLYVADTNNHAIRVVDLSTGQVSTLNLDGVLVPK